MTQRITITLPDPIGDQLHKHAARRGQPTSTMAGELLRNALSDLDEPTSRPATPAATFPAPTNGQTARWIEPYDDTRAAWRSETWLAILALYARYRKELTRLENNWWGHAARVETLAALAEWRNQLDHHATDPRDELAFQARIAELQHALEHTPGTGTNAFDPDAPPPDDWLDL